MKKIVDNCLYLVNNKRIRILLTRPFSFFVSVVVLLRFCFQVDKARQERERREEQELQVRGQYGRLLVKELQDLVETSMKSLTMCMLPDCGIISPIYNERIRIFLTQPFATFVLVAILLHKSCKCYEILQGWQRQQQQQQREEQANLYERILLKEIRNHAQGFQENEIMSVISSLTISEWNIDNTDIPAIQDQRVTKESLGTDNVGEDNQVGGIFTSIDIFNRDNKVMVVDITNDAKAMVAINYAREKESYSIPGNKEGDKVTDEDEVCAICLEIFAKGDLVCQAKNQACFHQFHGRCLTRWLVVNEHCCRRCPMCRNYM